MIVDLPEITAIDFFPELRRYDSVTSVEKQKLNDNFLVVKVTYDFPLRIPFINRILNPFPIGKPSWEISSVHPDEDAVRCVYKLIEAER